jgi:hypothetical protein
MPKPKATMPNWSPIDGIFSPQYATDEITEFLMRKRDILLAEVDQIERLMHCEPRTATIRRWYKDECIRRGL